MTFNASSIDLEVLLDTLAKAEQFIKKFANGYLEKGSLSPQNKVLLKSPDWKKNYYGLKHIYENQIIPGIEGRMRVQVEKENPGLSDAKINIIFNKRKETNIEFLRKNAEFTRITSAYDILDKKTPETNVSSGYGLGKATCGTCGKEKRDEEPTLGPKESEKNKVGWRIGSSKKHKVPKTYFCSQDCFNKFDWNNYNSGGSPGSEGCVWCNQPIKGGDRYYWIENQRVCVSCVTEKYQEKCQECGKQEIPTRGSSWVGYQGDGWFCCREHHKKWKSKQSNSGTESTENSGTESEEDISESKPIITNGNSNRGKENNSNNDNSNHDSGYNSDDNSDDIPNQNEDQKKNSELPKDIQAIINLPLPQAKQQAEQKIEKLLKDNGISEQELSTENIGEGNWKDYLKNLDNSQAVGQFVHQMQQEILKKALTKRTATDREEQKPKDGWIKPTAIIVLSLLVLSTLIIIIRKRKPKGF